MTSRREVLVAWQSGAMQYRDAMQLTGARSLFELYEFLRADGVPIRTELTPYEIHCAALATADILALDDNEEH